MLRHSLIRAILTSRITEANYALPCTFVHCRKQYLSSHTKNVLYATTESKLTPQIQTSMFVRKKSKSSKQRNQGIESDEDSDDEDVAWDKTIDEDPDESAGRDHTDVVTTVSSLRMDTILKASFTISNSKIEAGFYSGKLRVNGQKVMKLSRPINVGDEVDMIIETNLKNPKFLDIMRVVLLAYKIRSERIRVKLRKFKKLTVREYAQKWSPPVDEQQQS